MKKLVLLFLLFTTAFAQADISGRVQSIHDGDTLNILEAKSGKKARVRLLGVDTPEIDFNGHSQGVVAERARDYLRSLIPINAEIIVKPQEKSLDSNGRYLGQVFYQGQDINYKMLKAGQGVIYFIYPFDKKLFSDYSAVAQLAQDSNAGMFSDEFNQELLPYIFRQKTKGFPGNNFPADFKLKKLYQNVEDIPVARRVFFASEADALSQGYRWN